ncbi:MAG: polyphosphate polymerase domain-containing protein [Desulfobacteraceae bacterium]|jgi:hypothetical protein
MKSDKQKALPPRIERYELKYTIPYDYIEPISQFASAYCALDKYSEKSESKFYQINNLYFDSPNYLFLKRRVEHNPNRFNMRIRAYTDNPGTLYFLEIKHKIGDVIRKYRSMGTDSMWFLPFVRSELKSYYKPKNEAEAKNRKLFLRLVETYNAAPKVLTQYWRKAYVSMIDDYARLTFDVDLRYMPENRFSLIPQEEQMVSCDPEVIFDPGCSVILELKCYTSSVPLWMLDLIKYFNLRRRSFSKYMTGIYQVFQLYRYDNATRMAMFL